MNEVKRYIEHPFEGDHFPVELGAVVQRTVAEGKFPALVVIHDADNDWLVGDGVNDADDPEASIVWHMHHLVDRDPSLEATATLPPGHVARRSAPNEPWTIEEWEYLEEDEE